MAKFTFDTDEQTIDITKVQLTSKEEFIRFVDGLVSAGAVLGWEYEEKDDDN